MTKAKVFLLLLPIILMTIANAQSTTTTTTTSSAQLGLGTTTIPVNLGLAPSSTPNAPSSISSITASNIPTQPLLIIYYNNANGGYYAYVLSNQTDASFFLNNPNVYENILPNATYYNQIPTLTTATTNNVTADLQAQGQNTTQIANYQQNLTTQLNNEVAGYAYTGAIFYSGYATTSPLKLECHFINSANCNGQPNGLLTINNVTNYISQTNTPYNATILYYNTNPSFSTGFVAGIETEINTGVGVVSACLNYNKLAVILSGGACNAASVLFTIANAIDSYFTSGNLAGKPIVVPQIPIPLYAEVQTSTPNALTLISSFYNPAQSVNVQFNYDNNMLSTTNMENSIFAFNTYVDGNTANQMANQFFNTDLLEIFVIAIVCYIVLKFNGA